MKQLKVIDLCCGAGLFSAGFQRAGFKIALGIDNDSVAISSFQHNFPDALAWETDLLEISNLPNCDVIIGGPECQEFSLANRKRNPDKGLDLVNKVIDLALKSEVKYWIMEEVPEVAHYLPDGIPRIEVIECSKLGSKNLRPRLFSGNYPDPIQLYKPVRNPSKTVMASDTSIDISLMKDLQGIPSWMEFKGTDAQKRRQIGNGVPIQVGESLASGIIWSIQGKDVYGHQDWHTTVVGSRRVRTGPRIYKSVPGWEYCEECETMMPSTSNIGVPRAYKDGIQ